MCSSSIRDWIDKENTPRFIVPIVDRYAYENFGESEKHWVINTVEKVYVREIICIHGYKVHVAIEYDSGKPIYFGKVVNS